VKKIAFFDFDGTITTKDTLFEVIKYQKGKAGFYFGFLLNAPVLIALKLRLVSNQAAKERILGYFFKGMELKSFQKGCDEFIENVLPSIIRPGALEEIKRLKAEGFEIVVVSASPSNWIKKWSDAACIGLIATKLQCINELLTGNIDGINNNSDEKAINITANFDLSQYSDIYCYGDSNGDKAMLALATKAFYKPFRN
jgi:phosphatidylglycerophosphatase C